jgi:lysophospholipase L1-like esterase
MKERIVMLCGMAAMLLTPLSTRCLAQTIAVKSGDSIAFMGDSITEQAWDSANGHWGWNSPVGHIHLIMDALEANGIKATAIPAGRSGHKSNDMLERLQRDVLDKKPTWLTLSCGVNDVAMLFDGGGGVALPTFKTNITAIVEQAQAAGIKVMILTVTPIYEEQPTNKHNLAVVGYNDFLRALVREKHCLLADLSADMQARRAELVKATGNPGRQVTADGVHLNTEGSMVTATGILRAFGFTSAQLRRAREAWMEISGAVILPGPPQSVSMRQFEQLQEVADERKCRLDVLVAETCSAAISNLLKAAPSPAPQGNLNLGKIMPLGDSITKGAPAGAYRDPLFALLKKGGRTFKFVGSLTENPTAALTAASQDHHEGHSSMGMSWIGDHVKEFFAANPPDVILLAIGANDIGGATVPELNARMDKLVTDIYLLAPNVKLYLASVTPQTGPAMAKIREFNQLIPGIVASHQAKGRPVTYVSMDALGLSDLEDNVHPNVSGSRKMAEAWYDALVN